MQLRTLLHPFRLTCRACQRRAKSDLRPFAAGDHVLLRRTDSRDASPLLRELKPGKRIDTHKGNIQHDDIIGKRPRDVVRSLTGRSSTEFRLFNVTLEEYVRLTTRLVTPLYGADANLIVSLLDLHPDSIVDEDVVTDHAPKLEILEAGTGHGALTLYLSRAIHAANLPRPRRSDDVTALAAWKARRRAIIHTIEASAKHSAHAEAVVRGFRHGAYAGNVDFHVGDVGTWLRQAADAHGGKQFLSHAILDLPGATEHLAAVAQALRVDGTLIVFKPSITQITDCAQKVKDERLPLDLSTVIELGVNGGTAGREWDVRFMRPRAVERVENASAVESETAAQREEDGEGNAAGAEPDVSSPIKLHLVCRPKVGTHIVGGGFLGLWKKRRVDS